MQPDPKLAVMAEIAQPLDEWCEFGCGHLATRFFEDGMKTCDECGAEVDRANAHYAAEAQEAAAITPAQLRRVLLPPRGGAAKARKKRRAKNKVAKASRKRNR